jgi:hypothetical protein
MGTVSRVHTFASGAILTAAQLNNEFDNLLTSSAINGGLDATNLGVTAGQATASKALVVDASRNLADATGSNRINNLALSGTFESTGAITASAGITSGGNIVSDTDSTDDLGTTGVRWANLFVDDITVTNNVTIGGTLTLTGGITLNGNTTIGDSSADTLTVNSTITSNLIFTDATYDIGASGATRPRNLYLSGNGVVGGTLGVTGLITATGGVSGSLTGNVTGDLSGSVTGGTISGTTGTFSSTLGVTGATTLSSDVGIGTSASATNRLTLSGNQVILASGELKFADAANSQVGTIKNTSSSGSQLDFITGGVTAMTINSAQDLAVDTDTLYVDASADSVGINTASPQLSVSTEVPLGGFDGFGVQYSNETKGELTVNPSTGEVRMGATNSTGTYFTTLYANGSEAARIDLSGNVGLGVTPSAWGGSFKALQVKDSVFYNNNSGDTFVGSNYYYDGTNNKYINTDYSAAYGQQAGAHIFYTAPSGTAGNTVSFTQAMTLTNAGLLGIGTSSPSSYSFNNDARLVVANTSANSTISIVSGTSSSGYLAFADGTTGTDRYSGQIQYNHSTNAMSFKTGGGVEAIAIDSSQRVGIGLSSASSRLHVNAEASFGADGDNRGMLGYTSSRFYIGTRQSATNYFDTLNVTSGRVGISTASPVLPFQLSDYGGLDGNSNQLIIRNNLYYDTGDARSESIKAGYAGEIYLNNSDGSIAFRTSSSAATGANQALSTTEHMRVTSAGNLGLGTASPDAQNILTLQDNTNGYVGIRFNGTGSYAHNWSLYGSGDGAGNEFFGLYDATNGTYRIKVDESGGVGIGVAPYSNYRFSVRSAGTSSATYALQVENSLAYSLFNARSDGRIVTGSRSNSPYNNTTASAANMYVDSSGILYRSTSSAKYKTGVETIEDSYADAILNMRPVWYRSLSEADNANHGWWGFIAEEVAEIDPRLVQYRTTESVISEESGREETVTLDEPIPEGVSYDRFVPLLLNLIQRQQQSIETLETKVAALEAA